MNNKSRLTRPALALAIAASFGLAGTASAAPCTAEVDALQTVLNDEFCQHGKLCSKLSRKLDKVNHRLEKGKLRKAGRKLGDFGATVAMIADEGKSKGKKRRFYRAGNQFDQQAYERMMGIYYNAAVACIENPGAAAPVPVAAEPDPYQPPYDPAEEVY